MSPEKLEVGDVVQIDPKVEIFGGAFMTVTTPKKWGAQGAVHGLGKGQAYYRCEFKDMEKVGKAAWVLDEFQF